jgi:hypothetical protein
VIVRFVDIGMVELLTITVLEMIVSFVDIGMVELLTITASKTVMVNNSTNIYKTSNHL